MLNNLIWASPIFKKLSEEIGAIVKEDVVYRNSGSNYSFSEKLEPLFLYIFLRTNLER